MAYPLSRKFNVQPSPVDQRDKNYTVKNIPVKIETDLREWDSSVEDQLTLGSCVSHALTSCFELMTKQDTPEKFVDLSRLFSYYHTRVLEDTVNKDDGVLHIRNALKAANHYGICKEELWPYVIENFAQQPWPHCYLDAAKRKVLSYQTIGSYVDILEHLTLSRPVMVGMSVFEGFMTVNDKNPTIPMPSEYDYIVGGHAVAIVGYSLPKQHFIVKNSFGKEWGENGYCYMSFDYLNKYVFEGWSFDVATDDSVVATENLTEETILL